MVLREELLTVAEVAVALAGFSALVALLGGRDARANSRVDVHRLQMVLESSLFAAAFALVPIVTFNLGIDAFWRVSAALWILCDLPIALHQARRDLSLGQGLVGMGLWAPGLSVLTFALAIAIVLGVAADRSGALYLAALFASLVFAGVAFIRFASSTFLPRSP